MTSPLDFDGRVALVTGGASGIGEACVRLLVARGARVLIADRAEEAATALAVELGGETLACALDVTDPESADAAVDRALQHFGRLDVAVNSAGVGVPQPADIGELGFEQWRRVLSVNLDGVFNSMHSEINGMLASGAGGSDAGGADAGGSDAGAVGSIVNIASVMSVVGTTGAAAYVAAKHGVVGLTRAAGIEYGCRGIRVNAVGPGHIDTAMFQAHPEETRASITSRYPVGRVGGTAEIAEFVCFIAGAGSAFATGAYFAVDGGYTAQ